MAEWPRSGLGGNPPVITNYTDGIRPFEAFDVGINSNTISYTPFQVRIPCVARKMVALKTDAAQPTVLMGIYDYKMKKIVSGTVGPVAVTTPLPVYVDIADTILSPGWYYTAFDISVATTFACLAHDAGAGLIAVNYAWPQMFGIFHEAGAALPATATPIVSYVSNLAVPCVGLCLQGLVY